MPNFLKLLGIIQLPGMKAPAAVESVGNWVYDPGAWLPIVPIGVRQDYGRPGNYPLRNNLAPTGLALPPASARPSTTPRDLRWSPRDGNAGSC
jgi:hypothetical protein